LGEVKSIEITSPKRPKLKKATNWEPD